MKDFRRQFRRYLIIPCSFILKNRRTVSTKFIVTLLAVILLLVPYFFFVHTAHSTEHNVIIPSRYSIFSAFDQRFNEGNELHDDSLTVVCFCQSVDCTSSFLWNPNIYNHSSIISSILLFHCHSRLPNVTSIHPSITIFEIQNCPDVSVSPSLFNLASSLTRKKYLMFISSAFIFPSIQFQLNSNNENHIHFFSTPGIMEDKTDIPVLIQHSIAVLIVSRKQFLNLGGVHEGMPSAASALNHFVYRYPPPMTESMSSSSFIQGRTTEYHDINSELDLAIDEIPYEYHHSWSKSIAKAYATRFQLISTRKNYWQVQMKVSNEFSAVRNKLRASAEGQFLHERYQVPYDIIHAIERNGNEAMSKIFKAVHSKDLSIKGFVVLLVKHGLCNRLRALASGIVFANMTNRILLIDWRLDAHCGLEIDEILETTGNFLFLKDIRIPMISISGRSSEHVTKRSSHLWIGESDREVEGINWSSTSKMLQSFKFRREYQPSTDMKEKLSRSTCIHIRHSGYKSDVLGANNEYKEDWEIGEVFRQISSPELIGKMAMQVAARNGNKFIFVSADKLEFINQLKDIITSEFNVWGTDKNSGCLNEIENQGTRGKECMKEAVNDLLALGKGGCSGIIGSAYSSFSDVAGRIANLKPILPGFDFGETELNNALKNVSALTRQRIREMVERYHTNKQRKKRRRSLKNLLRLRNRERG